MCSLTTGFCSFDAIQVALNLGKVHHLKEFFKICGNPATVISDVLFSKGLTAYGENRLRCILFEDTFRSILYNCVASRTFVDCGFV